MIERAHRTSKPPVSYRKFFAPSELTRLHYQFCHFGRRISLGSVILPIILIILSSAPIIRACDGVSNHAYPIVVNAAIDAMPPTLRAFLDSHREPLALAGIDPDRDRPASEKALADEAHYVWLDIGSSDSLRSAHKDFDAAGFPRSHDEARALCRRANREACGSLPWAIKEHYQNLVAAFRNNRADGVLITLPPLLHLVTDASMPLNVTADAARGPVRRSRSEPTSSQAAAVDRLHARLAFEVRVWPDRVTPIDEPIDAVFDQLIGSFAAIESLREFESSAPRSGRAGGGRAAQRGSSQDDAWASLMRDRLEAGALLAARLITAAWQEAGRPELAIQGSGAHRAITTKPVTEDADGFAGSRDSTVFHRAGCAHVARIKPENLVRFASLTEATATGRNPCRSCRPGSD